MFSHGPPTAVLPVAEPDDAKRVLGFKRSRSEFMDSDGDLTIFRRFGELGIRNLLHMQARLVRLECELQAAPTPIHPQTQTGTEQTDPPAADVEDALMLRLQGLLKEYNTALLVHARVQQIPSPSSLGMENFYNAAKRTRVDGPADLTDDGLQNLAAHRKDLVSLARRETKGLSRVLDRIKALHYAFGDDSRNDPDYPEFNYYNEKHVERLERFIICSGFCVMLLLPTALLVFVTSRVWRLVITGLFTLVGCLGSAALTRAKNWEVLSVTAGYCAILVVFLGNLH